jgi:hypothetical protein
MAQDAREGGAGESWQAVGIGDEYVVEKEVVGAPADDKRGLEFSGSPRHVTERISGWGTH